MKNNTSGTKILFICFLVIVISSIIFVSFYCFDLGHKLQIMNYTPVSSYEELKAISENPNANYRLTKDIDMTGKEWIPFAFNGILDGDGHTISNLSISTFGPNMHDTYDGNMKCYQTSFAAMFDVIEDATIRNLTFSNVYVDVESDSPCFAGIIAGYMGNSTIKNCTVTGDVRLRAHDRMFGVGGVVGYGYGTLEKVNSNVTLVCIDTDALTKDEQFMGGLVGGGYPDLLNCNVYIDGYGSEHGYAHNGGAIGLYMFYPDGTEHIGQMVGNYVEGKITFFEDNEDRRAYCAEFIGEKMNRIEKASDNFASFQRVEVYNYDVDLLPEERYKDIKYSSSEQGYYDLEIEYSNQLSDSTYGLFINGLFYKKVVFPAGNSKVTETLYLDGGDNVITFKYLPGDGDISFGNSTFKKSDKQIITIVVPHQDDEILGYAGTIQKNIEKGNIVKVLFLTNGDYFGTDFTHTRLAESVAALSGLGVNKSDITVLGYGDFTLSELLESDNPDYVLQARSGSHLTYGDPTQNLYDYHLMNKGDAALYSPANIRTDLSDYLKAVRADFIYTTSEYEWHKDHKSAFLLTKEVLTDLSSSINYHPSFYQTVIHGQENSWPENLTYNSDGSIVITEFTNPFPSADNAPDWNKAIKITLSDSQVSNKKTAIDEFVSQNEDCDLYEGQKEYNYAFCKRDEFYWEVEY